MTVVRAETESDHEQVRALNLAAFDSAEEADLVDRLRALADPLISLVATEGDSVVGHIMFSPVTLGGNRDLLLLGLGPMAVMPARQRAGIGSRLVTAGLRECRQLDVCAVIVLGHPTYYPRFGFTRASEFGWQCQFEVPDDVFMALELTPGAAAGSAGTIRYHAAFGG
ncbi:MAG: GNAT family N-acetyltransferase [Longimicrobiales bacterium]